MSHYRIRNLGKNHTSCTREKCKKLCPESGIIGESKTSGSYIHERFESADTCHGKSEFPDDRNPRIWLSDLMQLRFYSGDQISE